MKKLVLKDQEIDTLAGLIGNLPTFPRTINETKAISDAVENLMQYLGSKVIEDETNGELQS